MDFCGILVKVLEARDGREKTRPTGQNRFDKRSAEWVKLREFSTATPMNHRRKVVGQKA